MICALPRKKAAPDSERRGRLEPGGRRPARAIRAAVFRIRALGYRSRYGTSRQSHKVRRERQALIESAQERWRAVNAPHLVALVRAGARFERGVLLGHDAAAA